MSATAADVLDIDDIETAPLDEKVSGIDTCPSTQETPGAVLFFGCMKIDLGSMQRLTGVMPEIMRADAKGTHWPGLMHILDAMKREICSGRVGYAGIFARLADVVGAMFIRGWVEDGCGNGPGLAAALRDPRLAQAILAIHREPGRNGSVAELAAESHISRSAFAERFQTTIGIPNRHHLDSAFNRRFTFITRFTYPDATLRARMWQSVWPATLSLADDVDFARLATHTELTGANISNVARLAAVLSEEQKSEKVHLHHIEHAINRELAKLGRLSL